MHCVVIGINEIWAHFRQSRCLSWYEFNRPQKMKQKYYLTTTAKQVIRSNNRTQPPPQKYASNYDIFCLYIVVSFILLFALQLIHSHTQFLIVPTYTYTYIIFFIYFSLSLWKYIVSSYISLLFSHWIAAMAVAVVATVAAHTHTHTYYSFNSMCLEMKSLRFYNHVIVSVRKFLVWTTSEGKMLADSLCSYFFKFCVHVLTFCECACHTHHTHTHSIEFQSNVLMMNQWLKERKIDVCVCAQKYPNTPHAHYQQQWI